MGKHAYLVMVHTHFEQVLKLLKLIDDKQNDIYLHIDQKVKDGFKIYSEMLKPQIKKSKIYLVNRHRVQWGGV